MILGESYSWVFAPEPLTRGFYSPDLIPANDEITTNKLDCA